MQNALVIKRPEWITDDEIKRISANLVSNEEGQFLEFEGCTKEQVEAAIYELPASQKHKEAKISKRKAVDGQELSVLQELTDLDLSKGSVFRFAAANNRIDRTNEKFSLEVLSKFAADINGEGRSLLFSHDNSKIIGRVFAAKVETDKDGNSELIEWAFILKGTKMPGQDIEISEAIESGLLDFVSVGFSAFRRKVEESDRVYIEYFMDADRGDHKEFTEQTELSIVYLGAQRGARKKEYAVSNLTFINKTNSDMNIDELKAKVAEHEATINGLNSEIEGLKTEKSDLEKSVETLTNEKKELSETVEKYLEPFRNNVLNLQKKFLPEPAQLTEDQVKNMNPDQVMAMSKAFDEKFKDEAGSNEGNDENEEKVTLGF